MNGEGRAAELAQFLAKLAEASVDLPPDTGTNAQLLLDPNRAAWHPVTRCAVDLLEHAGDPERMGEAARRCWPHVPQAVAATYCRVAEQLRSTWAQLQQDYPGDRAEAARNLTPSSPHPPPARPSSRFWL